MSDYVFQPVVLISGNPEGDEREIIAMKFIESMTVISDGSEEQVIERLKGDRHLMCRMVSGAEHRISMLTQLKCFDKFKLPDDVIELRQCIFEKWHHLVSQN
jgi:hypothetical protein